MRVTKVPSLLAFLGYTLFFGSVLVGPAVEYTDYERFCSLSLFKVIRQCDNVHEY